MIDPLNVQAGEHFTHPHPDIPGQKVTVIVDRIDGIKPHQQVHFHCIETNLCSPIDMCQFCEWAEYPNDWVSRHQDAQILAR
jgi:hypothetical protein